MSISILSTQDLAANVANELKLDQRRLVATFHDGANAIGDGTIVTLNGEEVTLVNISGTATSLTIIPEASAETSGDTFFPIGAYRVNSVGRSAYDYFESISAKGLYLVQFSGLKRVRMRLVSPFGGGTLTVKGS